MEHYLPYLNWLEKQQNEMKELVSSWCDINTHVHNHEGLKKQSSEIKKHFSPLADSCRSLDFKNHVIVDSNANKKTKTLFPGLLFTKRADAPFRVLLSGHMDTVFKKESSFQKTSETNHNTLIGPGVSDMKGGLVIMLYTLLALEKSPYKEMIGWDVVISTDEEIGSPGSQEVLEKLAKGHTLAMVFEPAHPSGAIVAARPSSTNYAIIIRGKSAHAGRHFSEGRSALIAASELAIALHALNDSQTIINVGECYAGGAANIVNDKAVLRVNVRSKNAKIHELIDTLVAEHTKKDGIWIEKIQESDRPQKIVDHNTNIVMNSYIEAAKALSIPIAIEDGYGVNDANIFSRAGIPTLDSIGAIGGMIHTHNEYLVYPSLVDRAKIAALFLMQLANGEIKIETNTKTIDL